MHGSVVAAEMKPRGSPATSKRRTCNLGFTVVTARDPSFHGFFIVFEYDI